MPLSKAQAITALTSKDGLLNIPNKVCDETEECICVEHDDSFAYKLITKTAYDEETGITKEWKVLVVDEEKKSIFQAEESSKETEAQELQSALKAMDCGKKSQAFMLVRNVKKQLTKLQRKQLVSTYSPIKTLLDTGSLDVAIDEISAVVPDGVIITSEDKVKIVEFINNCKP
jgi:hypothetical protein